MTQIRTLRAKPYWRIARYDLREWVQVLPLGVAYIAFVGVTFMDTIFYAVIAYDPSHDVTVVPFITSLSWKFSFLVPIFVALVGYSAIAPERASGTVRLYLGASYTKSDFFVGRLVARQIWSLIVVIPTTAGAVLVASAIWGFDPVPLGLFSAATLVLNVAFINISIATSAISKTGRRALLLLLGLIGFLHFMWQFIALLVGLASNPTVGTIVNVVDPIDAYQRILFGTLLDEEPVIVILAACTSLVAWCVVPVVLGNRVFTNTEV